MHAPIGMRIGGQRFKDGQWVPPDVFASATPEEKAAIMGSYESVKFDELVKRYDLKGKRVLEVGPYHGYLTGRLAEFAGFVLGIEGKPDNVRIANEALQSQPNARVVLGDVRELSVETHGRWDLIFHCGVLYHLDAPCEHLANVAAMTDTLYLETYYVEEPPVDRAPATQLLGGVEYHGYLWPEYPSKPKSGLQPQSLRLVYDDLLLVLKNVGFLDVEIVTKRQSTKGNWLILMARK